MTARQWLGRARGIDREISVLMSAKAETRDRLLQITQNYQTDGTHSTKDPHKYDQLVAFEDMIDRMAGELITVKAEISGMIMRLEDGRVRRVLIGYYVRCMTMEEIAVEQHYSYRQVKRFHRAGVDAVEDLLK